MVPFSLHQDKHLFAGIFKQHYGVMRINLNKYDIANPYPIIVRFRFAQLIPGNNFHFLCAQPLQRLLGCMTSICWHPVLTDILVLEDKYYLLLQEDWLWNVTLSHDTVDGYREQLKNEKAFRIKSNAADNQEHSIVGAFNDVDSKNVDNVGMLIVRQHEPCDQVVTPLKAIGKRFEVDFNIQYEFVGDYSVVAAANTADGVKIAAARVCNEAKIVSDEIYLVAFRQTNTSGYEVYGAATKTKFKDISAMFIHPTTKHLYIVSEYFLYIFEDASDIENSGCMVTPVTTFFQCDPMIYRRTIYGSFGKYLHLAVEYFAGAARVNQRNCKLVSSFFADDGEPKFGHHEPELPMQVVFHNNSKLSVDDILNEHVDESGNNFSSIAIMFILIVLLIMVAISVIACLQHYRCAPTTQPRTDSVPLDKRRYLSFNKVFLKNKSSNSFSFGSHSSKLMADETMTAASNRGRILSSNTEA